MNRDIAIVGISGKFPGAVNPDALFDNLKVGMDCVEDITMKRIKETTLPETAEYRRCGFLDDIDKFDHAFFGISFAEAKTMSPEQRLLLEVTHAAIENAGYPPTSLGGSNTAVFATVAGSEYYKHASEFASTLVTGNSREFLVAKIARLFNLKGSAMAIECSCSSSLVAVHNACNELITGDAEMAIVAGVNLLLFPFLKKDFQLDMDSKDGKSRAFSAKADGMSYGEIAAAIVLKPLEKALSDNDNIHAVIKGSAVNNNGSDSASITAPDSQTQADVLVKTWQKAGVSALDITYIEAHGSGTQLGDSLEIDALNLAFRVYTGEKHLCPISTVKSNLGHGRSVSGLAGLIKTVLCLKNKVLLPMIHFDEPSHIIDFANASVFVNTALGPWQPAEGKKRLAGVTSIGASGTNCHLVLEEAAQRASVHPRGAGRTVYHIPVSGKTPQAMRRNMVALLNYLSTRTTLPVEDVSYTLTHGRDHYDYRVSFLVSSIDELHDKIRSALQETPDPKTAAIPKLILITSDSLTLDEEVIARFRNTFSVFDDSWNQCEAVLTLNSAPLKDVAFQYSLYQLLQSMGIVTDHLLPIGFGRIVQQIIEEEISLKEGILAASAYQYQPIQNKEERLQNLLNKFAAEENTTFLELSAQGTLYEPLQKYNVMRDPIYFVNLTKEPDARHALLYLANALYGRRVINRIDYRLMPRGKGKKIELPTYQFEPKRCWLRETPLPMDQQAQKGNQGKSCLKEDAGNMENKLAEIFSEVLELSELSVFDNFFELGGDSLKATKVIGKINRLYQLKLNFEDLFDFPSIEQLTAYLARQVGTEKRLLMIWEMVLQQSDLTPEDNFFELGGHSLLATSMILLIKSEFNISLNFEDIFRNQTVTSLSSFIDAQLEDARGQCVNDIKSAPLAKFYKLTFAQQSIWAQHQKNTASNNVMGVSLEGPLDEKVIDKAIRALLEKHESLRTIFKRVDQEPRQVILQGKELDIKILVTDARNRGDAEMIIDDAFTEEYTYTYDLSTFPLFRIRLIRTAPSKHICILNLHPIISDRWSMAVFTKDFFHGYEKLMVNEAIPAPLVPVQVKDYAEWQRTPAFATILERQQSYWLSQFRDPVPPLSLPYESKAPDTQAIAAGHVCIRLGAEQTNRLRDMAQQSNATLFMVLLTAYNILLGKSCDSEDVVVGTPMAGRHFGELNTLVGSFENIVAIRTKPLAGMQFKEFLASVAQTVSDALKNQDYPFDELVRKLQAKSGTGRNPLFDTMFLVLDNKRSTVRFADIMATPYPHKSETIRLNLITEVREYDNDLHIDFAYSAALFSRKTIDRLTLCLKTIISAVTENAAIKIGDIDFSKSGAHYQRLPASNTDGTRHPV
ncbi:MAG: condensation domain-containing protein [Ginsengibacter sp.]